jgi:hypothetical protein
MSMNTVHLQVEIESESPNWTIFHISNEANKDRAWEKGSRMAMNIMADSQYYGNPKSVRFLIDNKVANQVWIRQELED